MPRKRKPTKATPAKKQTINGILIQYPENSSEVKIQALGSVRVTELPTLLRQGAKVAELELGV